MAVVLSDHLVSVVGCLVASLCLLQAASGTYCPSPPSLKHGWHNGGMQRLRVGFVILYSCDEGYRLEGAGRITCVYSRDRRFAYWKGDLPVCRRMRDGGRDDDDEDSSSDSSSYSSDSSSHSSSSSSSQSRSLPWKKPASRCPRLSNPANGMVHVISYSPGGYARYRCNYGYLHTGMTYRKCQSNGVWAGEEPTCFRQVVECPVAPNPSNGRVKYTEGRKVGAKIWYICNEGYTLQGAESRACLRDMTWSGSEPVCKRSQCPEPEDVENGTVSYTSTSIGSRASYDCSDGFVLRGSKVRVCQSDLMWTPKLPECEERTECDRLRSPKNGFVVVTSRDIGSHVKYNCFEGFYLKGPKFRECLSSGWSDKAPKCLPVHCDKLKAPKYGRVLYSNAQFFNSTASYVCDYCYTINQTSGDTKRRCQEFGEWTGKSPQCIRIDCGRPEAPLNGSVWWSGTELHSRARYSCDSMHVLRGSGTSYCKEDGQWSGSLPSCTPKVVCSQLPNPAHGSVNIRGSGQGSRATYTCSRPYVLRGEDTRVCLHDGGWSGDMPTCQAAPQKCDMPQAPVNGRVNVECLEKGCKAYFSCNRDCELQGRNKAWCLKSLQWSSSAPRCVRRRRW